MSRLSMDALAWALVHFIWQGAAIALLAFAAGHVLRRRRAEARYAVYCGALVLMLAGSVATFFVVRAPAAEAAVRSAPAPLPVATAVAAADSPVTASPAAPPVLWLPILVRIWLAGVALLSVRSFGGWLLAQRLKIWKTEPSPELMQRAAVRLRERLGIRRAVRIANSKLAHVPAAVGWLRPVVLLPVSAFTALTPDQIEMVLAHELAHIRRHDYLVNLVQTGIETLLFYHPAVWWVSGRIRAEREHCCDDLAVAACGNPVGYAAALAALEGTVDRRPMLAVAATGGSLLERIQRVLHRESARADATPAWLGALIPAAVLLLSVVSATPPKAADPAPQSAPESRRGLPGFLGGLADAGYTDITVDEIIALKEHGVEPRYIKSMLAAGLGRVDVKSLIRLREHGVDPEFVAGVASSGLVNDLDVTTAIRLRENGVDGDDMAAIRKLGFGPYVAEDVIRLRQNGVGEETFIALKEAGADRASARDAVEFRQNGITVDRIREMKRQGFKDLSLEQILKLSRSGVI